MREQGPIVFKQPLQVLPEAGAQELDHGARSSGRPAPQLHGLTMYPRPPIQTELLLRHLHQRWSEAAQQERPAEGSQ
eukprot:11133253-Alexandrium_andersonii.AAC.1